MAFSAGIRSATFNAETRQPSFLLSNVKARDDYLEGNEIRVKDFTR